MTDEFNETLEQLELLIGGENAKKVVEFFEGMNIYFPKNIGLSKLHNRIYEDLRNGVSYREAAAKYGYSESHSRKIEHIITNRKRRERQSQKPGIQNTADRPKPPVRIVPPKAADCKRQNFSQGDLFYSNGD
jgi:hypothetical protein